jgi:DnaJ-class molecular chaperone
MSRIEATQILGITTYSFNSSTLKLKYREMARKYHPDMYMSNGDPDIKFTEKMAQINLAYEALAPLALSDEDSTSDTINLDNVPQKKPLTIYDTCPTCHGSRIERIEHNRYEECMECDPVQGPRSIFDIFHWVSGTGSGRKTYVCKYCNGEKKYTLKNGKESMCSSCNGKGYFTRTCHVCNGKGYKINVELIQTIRCRRCDGLGEIPIYIDNPVIRPGAILVGEKLSQKERKRRSINITI